MIQSTKPLIKTLLVTYSFILIVLCIQTTSVNSAPKLSWYEVGLGLNIYPPEYRFTEQRANLFKAIDAKLNTKLIRYQKELVSFYRARVDEGLDALEQTSVDSGVLVCKFYSSSVVLKSAKGIVVMDLAQGPIQNNAQPEKVAESKIRFYWTPAQRERLAQMADVMLITHRHHDHADYSLAQRMIDLKKQVIGPAQLKEHWLKTPFAQHIRIPNYGTIEQIGPAEMMTFEGAQYSGKKILADGTQKAVPGADDSETVAYLVKLGEITFLLAGENCVPLTEWLQLVKSLDWSVNVVMEDGMYESTESVQASCPKVFQIPIHDHELKHEGGGNALAHYFDNMEAFSRHQMMVLMWGETFHITKGMVAFSER